MKKYLILYVMFIISIVYTLLWSASGDYFEDNYIVSDFTEFAINKLERYEQNSIVLDANSFSNRSVYYIDYGSESSWFGHGCYLILDELITNTPNDKKIYVKMKISSSGVSEDYTYGYITLSYGIYDMFYAPYNRYPLFVPTVSTIISSGWGNYIFSHSSNQITQFILNKYRGWSDTGDIEASVSGNLTNEEYRKQKYNFIAFGANNSKTLEVILDPKGGCRGYFYGGVFSVYTNTDFMDTIYIANFSQFPITISDVEVYEVY